MPGFSRPNKETMNLLEQLPQTLAKDIADGVHYRPGDDIMVERMEHMDAYRREYVFRNHSSGRSYAVQDERLQFAMANLPRGNKIFDFRPKVDYYFVDYASDAPPKYHGLHDYKPVAKEAWKRLEQQINNGQIAFPKPSQELIDAINSLEPPPTPVAPKPTNERPGRQVLVVAGNKQEADEFAQEMMGWKSHEWQYVDSYIKMGSFRNCSVYIVGTARDRKDFGAIEGLFILKGHEVLDMNE